MGFRCEHHWLACQSLRHPFARKQILVSPRIAAIAAEFRAQARPCMFPFQAFSAIFFRWRLPASEASGEPPADGEIVQTTQARQERCRG